MSCKHNCNKDKKIYLEALNSYVDCPECVSITAVVTKKNEYGITIEDVLEIPQEYQDIRDFDVTDIFNEANITASYEMLDILDRVNVGIATGNIVKRSLYIHTPNQVEIEKYVYATQIAGIQRMYKVSPYIDLNTLNGIRRASDYRLTDLRQVSLTSDEYRASTEVIDAVEGVRFIERTKLTYQDFVDADVCLLRATANTQERGWNALADILEVRARHGRPTIVFGYWATNSKYIGGLRFLLNRGSRSLLRLLDAPEYKSTQKEYSSEPLKTRNFGNRR